jgi:nucleoside-diphosphate kinase
MSGNITFTMVKPDATSKNYTGEILSMITKAGFQISAIKMVQLTRPQAEGFYAIHNQKPWFGELIDFMTSGPVVAAILKKENAVETYRTLIGSTNPANAAEGTIRKKYASAIQENAVHGSDSDENAIIESDYFFSKLERI